MAMFQPGVKTLKDFDYFGRHSSFRIGEVEYFGSSFSNVDNFGRQGSFPGQWISEGSSTVSETHFRLHHERS